MAYNVTPTSGAAPYTFTAGFLNKNTFNYGYSLRVYFTAPATGNCPLPALADNYGAVPTASLLADGVWVRNSNVPAGNCVTSRMDILDPLGNVVDSQHVNISNL